MSARLAQPFASLDRFHLLQSDRLSMTTRPPDTPLVIPLDDEVLYPSLGQISVRDLYRLFIRVVGAVVP